MTSAHSPSSPSIAATTATTANSSGCVKIVAAGKGRTMSHPKMVETVLDLLMEKKQQEHDDDPTVTTRRPRVVYLGTASFDDEERMLKQIEGFQQYDCEIVPLKVSHCAMTHEMPSSFDEMKALVHSADIIQTSGGNTLYALQRWRELGLDQLLHEAATTRGTVICGGSAGAMVWFEQGHSASMNPVSMLHAEPDKMTEEEKNDWDFVRVHGLGLIPGLCVPHHDIETHLEGAPTRSECSHQMLAETPDQLGIGIDEGAALVWEGDEVRVVSTDGEASCHVKTCRAGDADDDHDDHESSITEADPTSVVIDEFVVSRRVTEEHGSIPLEDFFSGKF